MSRSRAVAGGLVSAVGGLAVAGATTAPWVEQVVSRAIGDAEVTETLMTRGVELTRVALPLGMAIAVVGILLAALGAGPRGALALATGLAGILAALDLVVGIVAAAGADGAMTAAPGLAGAGAVAVIAGSGMAVRARRGPALPSRFDIDSDIGDDEWSAATEPDEGDR